MGRIVIMSHDGNICELEEALDALFEANGGTDDSEEPTEPGVQAGCDEATAEVETSQIEQVELMSAALDMLLHEYVTGDLPTQPTVFFEVDEAW